MAALLELIFGFFILAGIINAIGSNIEALIITMISGGIGFGLASSVDDDYGVFGAILGVLVSVIYKLEKSDEVSGIVVFLITLLIGGGFGFLLGSLASPGWGIFGAILGVLLAINSLKS
jgi:hypothetical protein